MLGIILQVLDIEGCTCYHVYNPLTLLTLSPCLTVSVKLLSISLKKKKKVVVWQVFSFFFACVQVSAAGMCVL